MNEPTGQSREAPEADRPGIVDRAILFIACALVLTAVAVAWPCPAQGVFTESFDTDTATTQQTLEAYPYLSLSRPTQGLAVRDGVLYASHLLHGRVRRLVGIALPAIGCDDVAPGMEASWISNCATLWTCPRSIR